MRKAFEPEGAAYVPVDEIARRPRTRILRAIRHFDWVSAFDLFEALDVSKGDDDGGRGGDRNRYHAALIELVKNGLVERRGTQNAHEYRLASDVDVTIPPPAFDAYLDAMADRRSKRMKAKRRRERAA